MAIRIESLFDNKMMMNRATTRSRVPLGQHNSNVNVHGNTNGNNGKSTILPPTKKKDSRTNLMTLERKPSTSSGISEVSSTTGEGNKAFTSLSSETLRRAISSASVASSSTADNNNNDSMKAEVGNNNNHHKKKKPLATSKLQNQQPQPVVRTKEASKSSSSEPVTIVEHRKRPCGDGYTVHKYLRGKLLGKGGFAKVYKVTSLDTNKEYAVKIVPKANLVKSRARQKVSGERECVFVLEVYCFAEIISVLCSHMMCHPKILSPNNHHSSSFSYKLKSRFIEQ